MNTQEQQERLTEVLELYGELQQFKGTKLYKAITDLIDDELGKMKYAYDCTTLEQIATLRGKREGLTIIADILEQIASTGERAKEEAEATEEKKRREEVEIDSTDL
jgi:hypothetical protein